MPTPECQTLIKIRRVADIRVSAEFATIFMSQWCPPRAGQTQRIVRSDSPYVCSTTGSDGGDGVCRRKPSAATPARDARRAEQITQPIYAACRRDSGENAQSTARSAACHRRHADANRLFVVSGDTMLSPARHLMSACRAAAALCRSSAPQNSQRWRRCDEPAGCAPAAQLRSVIGELMNDAVESA